MEDSQLDSRPARHGLRPPSLPPHHKSPNEAQLGGIYHLDGPFCGWSKQQRGMETGSQTCSWENTKNMPLTWRHRIEVYIIYWIQYKDGVLGYVWNQHTAFIRYQ